MEGDEGSIFSRPSNWKPFFLLKIKIKQSPDCPDKEYKEIFEHIDHNIKACFDVYTDYLGELASTESYTFFVWDFG